MELLLRNSLLVCIGLVAVVNAQCVSTNLLFRVTASTNSSTVTALNNVTFMCIPSSPYAMPDGYSWHRVDGDIPSHSSGQNTDTLTIHRIVPADEGMYYCMAIQHGHCAVSNNVMVTVEGFLYITGIIPNNSLIAEGGTAQFNITANSIGLLSYQWKKINVFQLPEKVLGNDTAILRIPNLDKSDEGQYYCIVTNEWNVSITSYVVNLTVYGPPNIMTHPSSQLVTSNMSFTLDCEGTGRGSITYQWETRNINRRRWMKISNSSSLRLSIPNLEESQLYRCIVSNEAGSTRSSVATVNVLKITTHPQNKVLAVNSVVNFICTSSLSSNVIFSWTHNGTSIHGWSTTGDTSILTITNVRHSDTGSYECTVRSGSVSVMSNSATLTVYGPPVVVNQPSSSNNIPVRGSITLTCSASGLGTIIYSWERNSGSSWTTVSNDNTTSYTTDTTLAIGQYMYRCRVNNEAGSVVSNIATVNVYGPPRITNHPANSNDIPVRSSMILMCGANGVGMLVYSWERSSGSNWITVNNDNTTSYTTDTTLVIGQYMYRCRVNNEAGSVVSNIATVNVYGPPTITTHPASQLTNVSISVTLDCEGTGRGSITYQWETSNINGGQWMNISNSNKRRIVVEMLQQPQRYRCVVSNEAGSTRSDIATVTVLKISSHPVNTSVFALQDVTLHCSASVDDVTYSWHRVNGDILSGSTGQYSDTFTILRATPFDEGMYYCIAWKSGISTNSSNALIEVDDQLAITVIPSNSLIGKGTNAYFTAVATGKSTAENNFIYQWMKKDSVLSNKVSGVNGSVLTIPNVLESDEGQYYCIVTNEWDRSVESNHVTLAVFGPPTILVHPGGGDVPMNGNTILVSQASGLGTLEYSWERNSGSSWTTVSSDNTTSYTTDTTLAIGQYMYRCRVSNEAGSVLSNIATVNVYGPPTITTHPASQLTNISISVTLDCEGTGRGSITYQWETSNFNGGQWMKISNSNSKTFIVGTLEQSQQYRCVVSNEAGSIRSNVATVTVLEIVTQPISSVTVIALEDVTLTCSASVDQVAYSWHRVSGSLPSRSQGHNSNTLTIPRLTPHDEGMYYCIATRNKIIVQSNRALVRVDDQLTISVVPSSLEISEKETAQFNAVADGINKINFMYQWRKRGNSFLSNKLLGVNETVLVIPDLSISDQGSYYCTVTNEWDRAIESGDVTLIVKVIPPPPPEGFRITDINIYEFQLTWIIIMDFHDKIDHYAVHYNLSDSSEETIKLTNFSGMYTLANLRPYTVYSVYVTAIRSIGNTGRTLEGIKSVTITERTLAGQPVILDPIPGLQTIVINEIELTVNTTKILLPVIGSENGPFSYLYIVIINGDAISSTEHVVENVEEIATQELLAVSMEDSPPYFYIAAVVNASDYVDGYQMAYILGAEDNTTDIYGHRFYNRQLKDKNFKYFFRIFSISSTLENEISTTTNPESVPGENSDGKSGVAAVVGGVVAVLVIIIIVIVLFIVCLMCYRKRYLRRFSQFKHSSFFTSGKNSRSIKEKGLIVEEKIALPVLTGQTDKLTANKTAHLECTLVKTSINQPTTLITKLTDKYKVEVTWKRNGRPVNHPVLPDGSLYIVNTSLSDNGEYSVKITRNKRTTVENLQLIVVEPTLPPAENSGCKAVKVKDFAEHVALLNTENNPKIVEEFESLVIDAPFTEHAAKLPCNKAKNRYINIIPYDHSRVVLTQRDKITGSDYINASYIDGFEETRGYISTQGPMKDTVDDFWRMIWEHNVATIVMLTRIEEDNKVKCHQYWPNSGVGVYGNIKVTLQKEEELTNYCLRQFVIEQAYGVEDQTHLIYQFHFTAWPDHDVPKHPTALLVFHKKVNQHHIHRSNKPMLVHCSAGIGRSGMFIAIDTEIQHMKKKSVIDIYNCVRNMRFWRNSMVQTVSQYSFIHRAVLEHITCGTTSITAPIDNIEEIIYNLSTVNHKTYKTGFQQQFENLEKNCSNEQDFDYTVANLSKNQSKNRCQKFLPPDSARVIVPQLEGNSNYINFCYIDDYNRGKAFLAGPGPMRSTASDFWKMIWEKNSYVIVLLGSLEENNEEVCYKYWPGINKTAKFGKLSVEKSSDNVWGQGIIKRIFKVTNTEENNTRTVTQLQYKEWSQSTCPNNYTPLLNILDMVESIQRVTNNGPITIHCSDGVGRSGTFCAIAISINQFKAEQKVDIFQIIRIMRTQRPGVVANTDQFKFIHNVLVAVLKQYDTYHNFAV